MRNETDTTLHAIPDFSFRLIAGSIALHETAPPSDLAVDPHHKKPEKREDDKEGDRDQHDNPDRHVLWSDFAHGNVT